ncbi:DUF2946 family protein [Ideonella livida]|uniref:DUF2946 domain-containing protein n=1 Tax=Ideonella livida TaxID=2707176 RepID=A0A7C9TLW6_9BURK|nr:DUF2946 family protein [Ideonella livida]NDY93840.1 hypothetical protein [Ideonella livida]
MARSPLSRRLLAGLLTVALLWAATWPVWGQWVRLMGADLPLMQVVCTSRGMVSLPWADAGLRASADGAPPADQAPEEGAGHQNGPCLGCCSPPLALGWPLPPRLPLPVPGLRERPPLALLAPAPLFAWAPAQARAPPRG